MVRRRRPRSRYELTTPPAVLTRRLIAIVLGASVAVAAAPPVNAAYYYACISPNNNYHEFLQQASVDMVKAWGTDPSLKAIHQCSGPTGGSFVLPINVQGGAFVQ